jgi:membrane protease YdiL (CAAX protease family)
MPLVNPGSGTDGITARRHYNGTTPLRYLKIILFFIFLPVPLFLLEGIFLVTGSGLSITDGNGVGQVSALLVVIAMVAVFSRFVAKERPFGFLYFYLRNWRPALRGFAIFGGVTLFLSVSAYAILWLFGKATISQEAIAAFNYKVFEDTVVTLLTALVVALTEEIVFRTFLMRYLRWNRTALVTVGAVLFSSFIFVISHRLDEPLYWFSGNNWQLFVGLFLLAVLLSVTYLSTASFLCNVGIHFGLLFTEVVRFRTHIIELNNDNWWFGSSYDVRMAPILWLLFICATALIFLSRKTLRRNFAIEKEVVTHGLLERTF